jgi:hypothetical protein
MHLNIISQVPENEAAGSPAAAGEPVDYAALPVAL